MPGLDHGLLNVPLAKRGDIDAQIDRYRAEEARKRRKADSNTYHHAREIKANIRRLLTMLPDERVLELAAPLGKRKPNTARAALASAAASNLAAWELALIHEFQRSPACCCFSSPCKRMEGACYDMAGRCAKCRTRISKDGQGCGCTAEEWIGPPPTEAETA